jgi:hypothetical protein
MKKKSMSKLNLNLWSKHRKCRKKWTSNLIFHLLWNMSTMLSWASRTLILAHHKDLALQAPENLEQNLPVLGNFDGMLVDNQAEHAAAEAENIAGLEETPAQGPILNQGAEMGNQPLILQEVVLALPANVQLPQNGPHLQTIQMVPDVGDHLE